MTILPFIISEDIHAYDRLWNMLSHFHLLFKIAQSQNEQTSLVALFDAALLLFPEEKLDVIFYYNYSKHFERISKNYQQKKKILFVILYLLESIGFGNYSVVFQIS